MPNSIQAESAPAATFPTPFALNEHASEAPIASLHEGPPALITTFYVKLALVAAQPFLIRDSVKKQGARND